MLTASPAAEEADAVGGNQGHIAGQGHKAAQDRAARLADLRHAVSQPVYQVDGQEIHGCVVDGAEDAGKLIQKFKSRKLGQPVAGAADDVVDQGGKRSDDDDGHQVREGVLDGHQIGHGLQLPSYLSSTPIAASKRFPFPIFFHPPSVNPDLPRWTRSPSRTSRSCPSSRKGVLSQFVDKHALRHYDRDYNRRHVNAAGRSGPPPKKGGWKWTFGK